jgi:hypothetical protein
MAYDDLDDAYDDAYEDRNEAAAQLLRLRSFKNCGPDAAEKRKMISMALINQNKFYVGSRTALDRQWGHRKIEHAIEHAKKLIEDTDEDQFIVQIVRVVKREKTPITVKKVGL